MNVTAYKSRTSTTKISLTEDGPRSVFVKHPRAIDIMTTTMIKTNILRILMSSTVNRFTINCQNPEVSSIVYFKSSKVN